MATKPKEIIARIKDIIRRRGENIAGAEIDRVLGEHPDVLEAAAIDGAGLAFVFEQRVEDDIREGRLIRVLDDWCAPFDGFYIYYPSRRQMRPALRAFIDFFRC